MAPDRFRKEVEAWSKKIGVKPKQIRIQPMTRKWASCSSSGRVSFARDLVDQRKAFREYVIVHELLHLKVPNHGKLFERLLDAFVPGWEHLHELRR